MPSPFPGMDPYIESQRWVDFHVAFALVLREMLVPRVRPRYVVEVEQYVYVTRDAEPERAIEPDVGLVASGIEWGRPARPDAGTTMLLRPEVRTLPMPARRRQKYLTIRARDGRDVVTVIEVLSPWNKAPGEGRTEYLAKRTNVLASTAHLVELDLLRGGERLPTVEPLPSGDFYALVARRERRPKVDVYAWRLRDCLPALPVPLLGDDPDVVLDLQNAFTTTYDRSGYDYALDYRRPVAPPLSEADAAWARPVVEALLPKPSAT